MSKELESMIFLEDTLSCFINNSNKTYCQVTFTRPQAREYLLDYKTVYEILSILKPLCEVVETPVKKIRYLKINGVVVYSFKKKQEYDTFKEWLDEKNN